MVAGEEHGQPDPDLHGASLMEQPADRSKRLVEFVVTSPHLSGPQLRDRIGLEGDHVETAGEPFMVGNHLRERVDNAWVVQSSEISNEAASHISPLAPIDEHLDWVFGVIGPVLEPLRALQAENARFVLRVVQYLDRSEFQGHGLGFSQEWTKLLGELGAIIDIDQYVE